MSNKSRLFQHLRVHSSDRVALAAMTKLGGKLPEPKFDLVHSTRRQERLQAVRADRLARKEQRNGLSFQAVAA